MRKSIKKVRAILKLIEAAGGEGLTRCQKQLGSVGRKLSDIRDADAMVAILLKLKSKDPQLFGEHAFARIRRAVLAHRQAAIEAAEKDGHWKSIDRALRDLRREAKDWRPVHSGPRALARGIRRAHRRGSRAMVRTQEHQHADDFHQWRKELKTLWYELRLIERAGPKVRRDVAALGRAEEALGDDHNLVVLGAKLSKDASICGGPVDLDRVRQAIHRYQCELRNQALVSARPIYAHKARDYARAMKRVWETWRRKAKDRRTPRSRRAAA
jgi:CHAD domain-containing protein